MEQIAWMEPFPSVFHFERFREDDYILQNLDANAVKLALNNWEALGEESTTEVMKLMQLVV